MLGGSAIMLAVAAQNFRASRVGTRRGIAESL
jgi:hypothetical protein